MKRLALIFSGIGTEWVGMAKDLYAQEPLFGNEINKCDNLLQKYSGWSVIEKMEREKELNLVEAHACIFSVQVGLYEYLRKKGITADAVTGHSSGEAVAAYVAGIISLEDVIGLVWNHCLLIEKVMGKGLMLHIGWQEDKVKKYISDEKINVEIAATNSPKATVVSGEKNILEKMCRELTKQNVFCRMLKIDLPFHSSYVRPHRDKFAQELAFLQPQSEKIKMYSSLYGREINGEELSGEYWAKHISEKVEFSKTIQQMVEDGYSTFLEVSPHSVLSPAMLEIIEDKKDCRYVATLKRNENEKENLLACLAVLENNGIALKNISDTERERIIYYQQQQQGKRLHFKSLEETSEFVINTIAKLLTTEKELLDATQGFFEMGLTSLMAIDLAKKLEKRLGTKLPATIVFQYSNIHLLAQHIYLSSINGSEKKSRKRKQQACEPIAVIGMGCRFPGGANSPEEYWKMLIAEKDAIVEIPKERFDYEKYYDADKDIPGKMYTKWGGFLQDADIKEFDARFFQISPKEAEYLDPQQRLLLEVTWEALENAGINTDTLEEKEVGVYIGICSNDFSGEVLWTDELENINNYAATGALPSCASGRLSYNLNLHGPNFPIDTACSSSLVAIHEACESLRNNESEMAIVGGVNLLITHQMFVYFCKLGAMSQDGKCKTFDDSANGYVRGEGCGVVVLKKLEDALKDNDNILTIIRSSCVNHDGASSSFTAPNGTAQKEAILDALENAQLQPQEIDYIEAHGTGTALGDPIEIQAIGEVYKNSHNKEHPLIVGSVKANIGHLEGAAGVSGLIKIILMMQNRTIPKQIHFKTPNKHIDWQSFPIEIPQQQKKFAKDKILRAGINGFGFSGTNAHIIIEEFPQQKKAILSEERDKHILTLSAKNRKALQELCFRYNKYLQTTTNSFADICYTSNLTKSKFPHKIAITAKNSLEALQKLTKTKDISTINQNHNKKIVFLFSGQGSQYQGMAKNLYDTHPVFRQTIEKCSELFAEHIEKSVVEIIYKDQSDLLHQTIYTQPAIFTIEYALAKLWQSWGIEPILMIGHSIGEYVAACIAGIFSLEDAIKLVAERAKLMQSLPQDGTMASVFTDIQTLESYIAPYQESVSIAVANASHNNVIAGKREVVKNIIQKCQSQNIEAKELQVSHAFHSPLMEPILAIFTPVALQITYNKPQIPIICNLTGDFANNNDLASAEYWTKHIRGKVRFAQSLEKLYDHKEQYIFLEIGGGTTLISLGKQIFAEREVVWCASLRKSKNDWDTMLESLSLLYANGVDIDWQNFDRPYMRNKVVLPNYPFQRKYHWILEEKNSTTKIATKNYHPFLGIKVTSPFLENCTIFESTFTTADPSFLKEHVIYNKKISPGAAHVSMMLSGAIEILGRTSCCLENIDFLEPLIIEEPRKVQLVYQKITNKYKVQLASTSDERWQNHAKAEWNLDTAPKEDTFELQKIRSNCANHVTGSYFHNIFNKAGYELGKHFQNIIEGWYGEKEALSLLEVKPHTLYEIHPGLLDSIWQSAMISIIPRIEKMPSANILVIPLNIGKIEYYAKIQTTKIWVHSFVRENEGSIEVDLTVWDQHEQKIMMVKNLLLRETNKNSLLRNIENNNIEELLFINEWQKRTLQPTTKVEQFIILVDNSGIGQKCIEYCKQHDISHTIVYKGQYFLHEQQNVFEINPTVKEHWQKLFDFLPQQTYQLLFTWSSDILFAPTMDSAKLLSELRLVCEPILFLMQVLTAENFHKMEVNTWLITQNSQKVVANEKINPLQYALWGMIKSIALEHPEIWSGIIDVDNNFIPQNLIQSTQQQESLVALRDDSNYVLRTSKPKRAENKTIVKSKRTYLITGGLGALGTIVIEWLIESGAKTIIVLGRNSPSQQKKQQISKWQTQGVEIKTYSVDVSNYDALVSIFTELQQCYAPLTGIIHAAGLLDDGTVQQQNWQCFLQVLAPKVSGAWNLHSLTKDLKLDFFIMFSSVSSFWGSPGQSNYATANAFLDGLALWSNSNSVISLNWGPWEVGMATKANIQKQIENMGFGLLSTKVAKNILGNFPLLSQLGVVNANLSKVHKTLLKQKFRFFENMLNIEKKQEVEENWQEKIAEANEEQKPTLLENFAIKIIREILGIEEDIDIQQSLIDLGMDSLSAIELRNKINKELGADIPISKMLGGATIGIISKLLYEKYNESHKSDVANDIVDWEEI